MSTSIGFDIFARDHASQTFDRIGKKVDDSGSKLSKFGALAGAALGGAAIALTGFAIGAVKKASDLNETINKSSVIFGKNADEIDTWAKGAAKNLGLSRQAALEAASGFGDMFLQLGFGRDAAANMSKKVVDLAADLGSFSNVPTAEVSADIAAAFRGEYDALQKLIPNINDARVKQVALKESGKKSVDTLTAQEKAHAILTIVQKDGARAAGDFARTSDGLANQSKIARARFEDLQATIGTKLLPVVSTLLDKGLALMDWMEKNPGKAKALGIALAVLAGAFALAAGAAVLMNLAFIATPVGALITGLVLLAGALIVAYKRSQTFRDIVSVAFYAVKVAVIGMALQAAIAFQGLLKVALFAMGAIIHNAAVIFGWLPFGIGQKLKDADTKFTNFKNSANSTMAKVRTKLEISLATSKAEYAAARLAQKMHQLQSKSITIAVNYRVTAGRIWDGTKFVNVGLRAAGGPVRRGHPYIVGEHGPELIYPKGDGVVMDAKNTAAALAGGNGRTVAATDGGAEILQPVVLQVDSGVLWRGLLKYSREQGIQIVTA